MIDLVSYLNTGLSTTPTEKKTIEKDMGKDAFLQLLVSQMSNQNPLEPMENTEFLSQLAQFSSLEQQQNIASGIELLALTQTASTNSQMVNLIGKRVIVPGNDITLDGNSKATLKFDLKADTAVSEIVILNDKGQAVRRMSVENAGTGSNEVVFDGKDQTGNTLAAGSYTYQVLGVDGKSIEDITQYSNYLVDAVAFDGSDILLKSGKKTISLGDISEVIQN